MSRKGEDDPEVVALAQAIAALVRNGVRPACTKEQRRVVKERTGRDLVEEFGFQEVEETSDAYLICGRAEEGADPPPLPARKEKCGQCGHPVWVGLAGPPHANVICIFCAKGAIEFEHANVEGVH